MSTPVELKIEKLYIPKGKKSKNRIIEPMPYKWTVYQGNKIYTYGYCHTADDANEIGNREYKRIAARRNRII